MRELDKAIVLNPANNAAHFRIGEAHVFQCEFQKALAKFETIDPNFIQDFRVTQICLALIGAGRNEEAQRRLDAHRDAYPADAGGLVASTRAMVHALFGQKREAEDAIREAAPKRGFGHFHHTAYQIACAYALMNKKVQAVEYLSKAADAGLHCYPLFECDANLANLRSDPGFETFLAAEKKHHERFKIKYGSRNSPSVPTVGERQ